jgi:hypothetical protein
VDGVFYLALKPGVYIVKKFGGKTGKLIWKNKSRVSLKIVCGNEIERGRVRNMNTCALARSENEWNCARGSEAVFFFVYSSTSGLGGSWIPENRTSFRTGFKMWLFME